jgi:hypothetical protein
MQRICSKLAYHLYFKSISNQRQSIILIWVYVYVSRYASCLCIFRQNIDTSTGHIVESPFKFANFKLSRMQCCATRYANFFKHSLSILGMDRPSYVCTVCSEHFPRKYSAKRHNHNIHNGAAEIVRLIDYLAGRS